MLELRGAMADSTCRGLDHSGLVVCECRVVNALTLRGDADNPEIASAVTSVFGTSLPREPNSAVRSSAGSLLWLSPDAWLAITGNTSQFENLRNTLCSVGGYAIDTSHMHSIIHIKGQGARAMLAHYCRLDLHQRSFELGACAQTSLNRIPVMLHRSVEDDFDVYVPRSYTDSVWGLLMGEGAAG